MRAHRGLTTITLAALTVSFATTGAVATDRDDVLDEAADRAPTAAVVPGSSATYVGWPPVDQEYIGEWTGANALQVSRSATTVDLTLPNEILALPFVDADVTIDAAGSTESARVAAWTDTFASGDVTLDMQAVLAQAVVGGVTDASTFDININRNEDDVILDLLIRVDLVDGAAGPAQVTLGTPPSKAHNQALEGTSVRVAPGGRVTVMAWPGFFGGEAPAPIGASVATANWSTSRDISGTINIWGDGEFLSVVVPQDVASFAWLSIEAGGASSIRVAVTASMRTASTNAVAAYVTAVYNDLFGRDPDPSGLTTWTNALSTGTRYSAVADAITSSAEFRSGLIRDAYAKYLGRRPDPAGLAFWLEQMRKGMHIQQMEAGFLASTEYYGYAGGTDADWLYWLYMDVLGREPAPSEISFWVPIVRSHGRGEVAKGFLYSTERLTTDVDGYYQWLLRRHLDPAGRTSWVRAIQAGTRVEAIIAGIISSAEYRNNVPVG